MTNIASFNTGVEAAAELHDKPAAKAREIDATTVANAHEVWAKPIRDLKHPEPSKDLRVERLAAWLADRYGFVEWSHSSEGERQCWRERARVALKAMEGIND